jgi:hypothetical protein
VAMVRDYFFPIFPSFLRLVTYLDVFKKQKFKTQKVRPVLVAHTCNPSYSKGRDQEDHGSQPAWANSSRDTILKKKKKTYHKKGLVERLKM